MLFDTALFCNQNITRAKSGRNRFTTRSNSIFKLSQNKEICTVLLGVTVGVGHVTELSTILLWVRVIRQVTKLHSVLLEVRAGVRQTTE